MLTPYSKILRPLLSDRSSEIEANILVHHPVFQQRNALVRDLLVQIEQNLPPGFRNLVAELDDRYIEQEVLAHEIIYLQGVKDGFNFRKFLRGCLGKK